MVKGLQRAARSEGKTDRNAEVGMRIEVGSRNAEGGKTEVEKMRRSEGAMVGRDRVEHSAEGLVLRA